MDQLQGSDKGGSNMNINMMNGAETNGVQNGDIEMLPLQQQGGSDVMMDYDEAASTQLLGTPAPDGNDPEDAESSGSSAAEMSGGTTRSSGGYSGDYSSISDESSSRAEKKAKNGHRKVHVGASGGDGGVAGSAMMMEGDDLAAVGADTNKMRTASASALLVQAACACSAQSSPPLHNGSQIMDGAVANGDTRRRHSGHLLKDPPRGGEHIHSYHHRHAHNHHHQPGQRGANKAKTHAQMNRQIDEIMNLYNVSLQAAAVDDMDDAKRQANETLNTAAVTAGLAAAAEGHLQVEAKGGHTEGMASVRPHHLSAPVPQLGGLRIREASDPRVDIQHLYKNTAILPGATLTSSNANANHLRNHVDTTSEQQFLDGPENDGVGEQPTLAYANLMEACRPFFHGSHALAVNALMASSKQPPLQVNSNNANKTASQNNAGSEQSSSGFTSFFASTRSESNQTNSGSGEGFFSEPSQRKNSLQQQQQQQGVAVAAGTTSQVGDTVAAIGHQGPSFPSTTAEAMDDGDPAHHRSDVDKADQSDASSMVVLARVKRKHKEQSRQNTSSSNSDNTNGSRKRSSDSTTKTGASKRVRIETVALDGARHHSSAKAGESSKEPQQSTITSQTSSLTQSLDSSGSDSGGQPKKTEEAGSGSNNETGGGSSNTDSNSRSQPTSSDVNQTSATSSAKPHVVTDISSGTTTTTANGSSGSGTGSSNDVNTTSKSESGSGDGNSDEQMKASGERDSTSGSDRRSGGSSAAPNEDTKPEGAGQATLHAHAKTDKPLIHHHHHGGHHEKSIEGCGNMPQPEASVMADSSEVGMMATHANNAAHHQEGVEAQQVSKEKIMEKKRKRMNMRREYEGQMRDSSESSSINHALTTLEPGKPVTLEEVLSFTKTARLLVQAIPPFLAVHVNAAFTSLCGIQSSTAIGTPVASMISLPDTTANKESDSSESDNTNNNMSSLSGSVEGNSQDSSNMAIANAGSLQRDGAGAPGDDNNHLQSPAGLRIDRLIVARGYGHIHDVEVVSLPHHSHSHAIEGSEVKFIEGNGPAKRKKKEDSKILSRMSVSPVISASPAEVRHHGHEGNVSHQSSNNSKRRKTRPNELLSVNHYLIQLEAVEGPQLLVSRSSYTTDTTMEAQILGVTKTEVHARRCRLERRRPHNQMEARPPAGNNNDDPADRPGTEDSQDDNVSSAMEPVATCG